MAFYTKQVSLKYMGCMLLGLSLFVGSARASELVYTPVNPNFGGNPFNGDPLLNSATVQNQYTEDQAGPDFSGLEGAIVGLGNAPEEPDAGGGDDGVGDDEPAAAGIQ